MAISQLAKNKPERVKPGPLCTVCRALEELPAEDSAGLLAMLKDPERRFTEIADDIAADEDTPEWVRKIKGFSYSRHARGECGSPRLRGKR